MGQFPGPTAPPAAVIPIASPGLCRNQKLTFANNGAVASAAPNAPNTK